MALQGTLDTFELPDVLRLLASTKKTGRLQLRGDRGEGSVWLQDGEVVGVDALGVPDGDAADGLFDLLRAREGGFAFEPGVVPEAPGAASAVEPLLAATEARLAEWREIETIVPSLHAWVSLNPELPQPELTVDAATWRLVATIGSGLTVGDLAAALDLPEVPVSRVVRDLVVLGLGAVVDAPPAAAPVPAATWDPPVAEVVPQQHASAPLEAGVNGHDDGGRDDRAPLLNGHADAYGERSDATDGYGSTERYGSADGYGSSSFGIEGLEPVVEAPAPEPLYETAAYETATYETGAYETPAYEPAAYETAAYEPAAQEPVAYDAGDLDDDADEVARQLAMLSPRAAQAVAAAAAADSDTERDAHLDALEDGEEPINRGLLLKFLSSVKS